MGNTKQAPKLIHEGDKMCSNQFYKIDQSLCETIFNELSGKNGNSLKLIFFLLGNNGAGDFSISEQTVKDRTGMDKKSYQRARKDLTERGWIRNEKGKIIVLIQNIVRTEHDDSSKEKTSKVIKLENRGDNKSDLEESSSLNRGDNKSELGSHVDGHNNIRQDNTKQITKVFASLDTPCVPQVSSLTEEQVKDFIRQLEYIISQHREKRNDLRFLLGKLTNYANAQKYDEEIIKYDLLNICQTYISEHVS